MRSIWDAEREFFQKFSVDDLVIYNNKLHIISSYNAMSCSIWLTDENGKTFRISDREGEKLKLAY